MNKAPTAVTVRASIVSKSLREKTNMNSIPTAVSTINVPFHGNDLYVVNHNGEPYTPMRPIIDGMGMDWASQFTKLKQRFKTSVVKITMQLPGDDQRRDVICLAMRKLAAWLNTISPNKVRPEIRERVIQYQEECDDVLYEYWTKGKAEKPCGNSDKTSTDDRTPLRGLVNRIMGKTGIHYQPLYKMIHREFGVKHIDELTPRQVTEAMEFLAGKVLEGEFIGKQELLPAPILDLNMPLKVWYENCSALRAENPPRVKKPYQSVDLNIPPLTFYGDGNWSPTMALVNRLEADGHDLSACRIEVAVMRKIISKLDPVVKEVDAIRGRRTISLMRVLGEKGDIILC